MDSCQFSSNLLGCNVIKYLYSPLQCIYSYVLSALAYMHFDVNCRYEQNM